MCPAHRSEQIAAIRRTLDAGDACRLVSTQLIEAGVDIDFPVVYRSLAGLDSVAQSAGRCNRNGRVANLGDIFLFRSEHVRSEAFFRETTNVAAEVLPLFEDPLSLKAIERYFRLYYWSQSGRWDARGVLDSFHLVNDRSLPFQFSFASVAQRFRLIEENGKPVVVPWRGRGADLCERLRRHTEPPRSLLRALQRYTVRIPIQVWEKNLGRSIDLVHERYPVLISPEISYDEQTGLRLDDESGAFLNA